MKDHGDLEISRQWHVTCTHAKTFETRTECFIVAEQLMKYIQAKLQHMHTHNACAHALACGPPCKHTHTHAQTHIHTYIRTHTRMVCISRVHLQTLIHSDAGTGKLRCMLQSLQDQPLVPGQGHFPPVVSGSSSRSISIPASSSSSSSCSHQHPPHSYQHKQYQYQDEDLVGDCLLFFKLHTCTLPP
jgi:hypothetical protein